MGDITRRTLFYFEPNADRTGLNLVNNFLLSDLIADGDDEFSAVTFGTGFTGISDIEPGLDGNLYVRTYDREAEGLGCLYRILSSGTGSGPILLTFSFPYVRDCLNEHPFKNTSDARLICSLNNGAPIKPEALWTVMKQLRARLTRMKLKKKGYGYYSTLRNSIPIVFVILRSRMTLIFFQTG